MGRDALGRPARLRLGPHVEGRERAGRGRPRAGPRGRRRRRRRRGRPGRPGGLSRPPPRGAGRRRDAHRGRTPVHRGRVPAVAERRPPVPRVRARRMGAGPLRFRFRGIRGGDAPPRPRPAPRRSARHGQGARRAARLVAPPPALPIWVRRDAGGSRGRYGRRSRPVVDRGLSTGQGGEWWCRNCPPRRAPRGTVPGPDRERPDGRLVGDVGRRRGRGVDGRRGLRPDRGRG
mmetsp:Transcript_17536/g.40882  ORF Transcript_17536/g.40882 Transcript_17536/m.40882 type:complete len:232 (-) Transcript_17536:308-1003(-)